MFLRNHLLATRVGSFLPLHSNTTSHYPTTNYVVSQVWYIWAVPSLVIQPQTHTTNILTASKIETPTCAQDHRRLSYVVVMAALKAETFDLLPQGGMLCLRTLACSCTHLSTERRRPMQNGEALVTDLGCCC